MFSDPLSLAFPPFVTCVVSPDTNRMLSQRYEEYNCHLTLMEMLEKFFIVAWFLLATIGVVALATALADSVALLVPLARRRVLNTSLANSCPADARRLLVSRLRVGDLFMVWVIKDHLTEREFGRALEALARILERRRARR